MWLILLLDICITPCLHLLAYHVTPWEQRLLSNYLLLPWVSHSADQNILYNSCKKSSAEKWLYSTYFPSFLLLPSPFFVSLQYLIIFHNVALRLNILNFSLSIYQSFCYFFLNIPQFKPCSVISILCRLNRWITTLFPLRFPCIGIFTS